MYTCKDSILDWLIAILEAKLVAKKLLTSFLNCVRAAFAVLKVEHVRFSVVAV